MEVSGRNQPYSGDINTGIQCDPCLCDGRTITAKWYCKECSEFMCDNCTRTHRNCKQSRNHELLDRDAMPRKKLTTVQKFCANHSDKLMEYFCGKHEQICCSACVTFGHNKCGVLYIDDIAGDFSKSQEYQDLLQQIKLLKTKLTESEQLTEQNRTDVNRYFLTLISDIQNFRSNINTKLDELENKVMEEAQKIKINDLKAMEHISTQIETMQKHLREMSSTLESLEKYKQNQQLFISSKHYLTEVRELKLNNEEMSFKNHIKKYLFQFSEDIFDSVDTWCKLNVYNLQNITCKDPKQIRANFVKMINIKHKQDRESDCWITGIDLFTCDTLALTDYRNCSVKLADLNTDTIISCLQLADKPQDLTCIDSNTLVVTCGTNLTFVKFAGILSFVKQIPMEGGCCGITSHKNKLFVTFTGKKPAVKILNSAGAVCHTIKTDSQGQNLFVDPRYITLSADGQTIYVSDWGQHTVTSYSVTGAQLYVYKHEELHGATGLCGVENKFIFVCGYNLHAISYMCEHIQIMLERKDMGGPPYTVLYNKTNKSIYISYGGNEFLSVFNLE